MDGESDSERGDSNGGEDEEANSSDNPSLQQALSMERRHDSDLLF